MSKIAYLLLAGAIGGSAAVAGAYLSVEQGDNPLEVAIPRVEPKPADRIHADPPKPAGSQAGEAALFPSLDVVRVTPDGEAVIAGRGRPGATIEILANGKVHATVVADAEGQFAVVPAPLPPGTHEITLRSTARDGTVLASKDGVTVVLDGQASKPLVALATAGQPTEILSGVETTGGTAPAVSVVTVESEEGGKLYVSGRAPAGSRVRLSINGVDIASGTASGKGRITFDIAKGMLPGSYGIGLAAADPATGHGRGSAEVEFRVPAGETAAAGRTPRDPDAATVRVAGVATAVVTRGDNLWRISKRVYGAGMRYTVIYAANQDKIQNPNRIYPGQGFVLPRQEVN